MFTDVGRPSGYSQSEWLFSKNPIENLLEGKPGPAAAVIPAPVAYANVAAVKRLAVECQL